VKPAAFSYLRPASIDEALALLAQSGAAAKVIAGGQSLAPMLNMRLATPACLIDLNDLSELAYVREAGDCIEIGALTRHQQIADSALVRRHCPLLARAAGTIGHYAIRQRGTLGGSLANADPTAQLALVAVTLGARLNLVRAGASRQVDAQAFLRSAMTTALAPEELIVSVLFPKAQVGETAGFRLFNRRRGDYAIVAAAVTLTQRDGMVTQLRIGVGGVAPVPVSLQAVAQAFLGRPANADWAREVALSGREAVAPEDDGRVSALYRRELTQTLLERALTRASQPPAPAQD
jgi:carbon-monoxide dehydrogenase medium subunit